MKRKWVACLVILAVALMAASSCRTPAGRTPGAVVDDSTITTKVKAKLLEDSITKGVAIDVDTFQGNVTLTGGVKTADQKAQAEKIAKSVQGVKKVNNNIIVQK